MMEVICKLLLTVMTIFSPAAVFAAIVGSDRWLIRFTLISLAAVAGLMIQFAIALWMYV